MGVRKSPAACSVGTQGKCGAMTFSYSATLPHRAAAAASSVHRAQRRACVGGCVILLCGALLLVMKTYTPRRVHCCAVAFVCLCLADAVDGFVSLTATLPRRGVELSTRAAVRIRTAHRTTTAMSSNTRSKDGQRSREEEKKRTPREIAGESKVGEGTHQQDATFFPPFGRKYKDRFPINMNTVVC